jgi:hypothetical protein
MFVNYRKRALPSACVAVAKMQLSASPSARALPTINGNWACPHRGRQSSDWHGAQGIGKDGRCGAQFDRKLSSCRAKLESASDDERLPAGIRCIRQDVGSPDLGKQPGSIPFSLAI